MFCNNKSSAVGFVLLISFMVTKHVSVSVSSRMSEIEVRNSVAVLEGGVAKLPCDVTPSFPGDKIHIVIWYKEGQNGKLSPIYSFDSRDSVLLERGKHWSDEAILGGRAHFRYQDEPAELTVVDVLYDDGGIYQCRVDFKQSPTRNSKVNLTVIIRPRNLNISDERGIEVSNHILGPYNEGSSINITCIATEGLPTPKVTWWQENALLDDSCEDLSGNRVRNILHIERLQRKHLRTVLTCQASNNDLVAPISTWIRIDLNLKPYSVKLLGENRPFSAGKSYQLECEVLGSRPAPRISWWKGGTLINKTQEIKHDNGTVISTISFTPSINDRGKYISCCADQPLIPDSNKENGWKLNILHAPLVTLELGNKLGTIKEGQDIFFECHVRANPWISKVSWKKDEKLIYSNIPNGLIISNQSLVLQSVTKKSIGIYTCTGTNREGNGESNPLKLNIHFPPVCRSREPIIHKVALRQTVRITCELEALPTHVNFIWTFNDTEIPADRISIREATSTIFYTPENETDYGKLLCSGENSLGSQKEPCIFYIIPEDKPEPLSNCFLLNQTYHSVFIKCSESFDSAKNQTVHYIAEVYNSQTRKLLKNLTSERPAFLIDGLNRGLRLEINLYGSSKNGRGDTTRLDAFIPPGPENLKEVLLPPENCSVTSQTRYGLRIKCQVPEIQRRKSLTYLLQVYDSNSRTLVGTSTSQSPDAITLTALPGDYQDLLVFIRGVDENSLASDAVTLHVPAAIETRMSGLKHHDSTSIKFHITPMLAITICVVVVLVFIAVGTLAVTSLIKKRSNKCNNKNCENDDRLPLPNPKYVNSSTEEAGELIRGVADDSENRNPDIIPSRYPPSEHDGECMLELINSSPPITYVKMEGPEDISTKFTVEQPDLTYSRHQPQYYTQRPIMSVFPNHTTNLQRNLKYVQLPQPYQTPICRNFTPQVSSSHLGRHGYDPTEMPLLESYRPAIVKKQPTVTDF